MQAHMLYFCQNSLFRAMYREWAALQSVICHDSFTRYLSDFLLAGQTYMPPVVFRNNYTEFSKIKIVRGGWGLHY